MTNRSVIQYFGEGVWDEIFKDSRENPKKFKASMDRINQDPKYKKKVYNKIENKMNKADDDYFLRMKMKQQDYLRKQYSAPKGNNVTPGDFMTYKKYKETNI
jgi:hypothetical protein